MLTSVSDIALLFGLAAALSTLAYMLRQPVVLAYLATGAIAGALHLLEFGTQGHLSLFSELGIMFLLFLVGLELNYSALHSVGKASLIIGLGQLLVTFFFGFVLAQAFHLSAIASAYVAIALTFSSTVVVVKLLSEKKDLNSLYGKLSLGFLLVQDLAAILILVALSSFNNNHGSDVMANILSILWIGAALFISMFYLGRKILPGILDYFARSQELLFLISLAWLFGVTAVVSRFGFSIEIGGLLAGLSLANSSERLQIAYKIRPLRDFFVLIFFVILGTAVSAGSFSTIAIPTIAFSLFILIGNPLIVLCLMGLLGYRRRTSFMAGVTMAQISEFSLILMALGLELGHVQASDVSLVTAVGVVTIVVSNYLILHSERIFRYLDPYLRVFERSQITEQPLPIRELRKSIILIGAHRTGQSIARHIPKSSLVIIDFDPEIIAHMKRRGYDCLFGDIADEEVREVINFQFVKVIISTSPSLEDNLIAVEIFQKLKREKNYHFHVIVRAKNDKEVEVLYAAGADYVLLPHFTAGEYLGQLLVGKKRFDFLKKLKKKDLVTMRKEHHLGHA